MKRYRKPAIFVLLALLFAGLPVASEYLSGPSAEERYRLKATKAVVMYGTKSCSYCQKARAYFTRHNIKFVEYDIEASAEHLASFRALGVSVVPVIIVGNKALLGFTPQSFKALLK
jgi:glutaredoxin